MDTLEGARASKAAADASLGAAQAAVAGVEKKLTELQNKFIEATEEKAKVGGSNSNSCRRSAKIMSLVSGVVETPAKSCRCSDCVDSRWRQKPRPA